MVIAVIVMEERVRERGRGKQKNREREKVECVARIERYRESIEGIYTEW